MTLIREKLQAMIRERWPRIVEKARTPDAIDCLPKGALHLLGSSRKVEKGRERGYLAAVQYLAPATESGRNVCPFATAGCAAACLGHNSGQLAMNHAQRARLWKTALRFGDPILYRALLRMELKRHMMRARRMGLKPAVRLDGSSDLGDAERIARDYPNVQFYDYTKSPARARKFVKGKGPRNYHVTFSYSGENLSECREILATGGNVAVVFNRRPARASQPAEPLPRVWEGALVHDADKDDLRFLDPPGVAGLRYKAAKERAKHLRLAGSFVVNKERQEDGARRETQ